MTTNKKDTQKTQYYVTDFVCGFCSKPFHTNSKIPTCQFQCNHFLCFKCDSANGKKDFKCSLKHDQFQETAIRNSFKSKQNMKEFNEMIKVKNELLEQFFSYITQNKEKFGSKMNQFPLKDKSIAESIVSILNNLKLKDYSVFRLKLKKLKECYKKMKEEDNSEIIEKKVNNFIDKFDRSIFAIDLIYYDEYLSSRDDDCYVLSNQIIEELETKIDDFIYLFKMGCSQINDRSNFEDYLSQVLKIEISKTNTINQILKLKNEHKNSGVFEEEENNLQKQQSQNQKINNNKSQSNFVWQNAKSSLLETKQNEKTNIDKMEQNQIIEKLILEKVESKMNEFFNHFTSQQNCNNEHNPKQLKHLIDEKFKETENKLKEKFEQLNESNKELITDNLNLLLKKASDQENKIGEIIKELEEQKLTIQSMNVSSPKLFLNQMQLENNLKKHVNDEATTMKVEIEKNKKGMIAEFDKIEESVSKIKKKLIDLEKTKETDTNTLNNMVTYVSKLNKLEDQIIIKIKANDEKLMKEINNKIDHFTVEFDIKIKENEKKLEIEVDKKISNLENKLKKNIETVEFDIKKKWDTNLIEINELIGYSIAGLEKDNEKKINEKITDAKNEIEKTINVNKYIINSKIEELNVNQKNNSTSITSEITTLNEKIETLERSTKKNETLKENQISENLKKTEQLEQKANETKIRFDEMNAKNLDNQETMKNQIAEKLENIDKQNKEINTKISEKQEKINERITKNRKNLETKLDEINLTILENQKTNKKQILEIQEEIKNCVSENQKLIKLEFEQNLE